MTHPVRRISAVITIVSCFVPNGLLNVRVEGQQTRRELQQRKTALEQEKAQVMKDLSKNAFSLYDSAGRIIDGFIDLNKAALPGAAGKVVAIVDIIQELGRAKEALKRGDKNEFAAALREAGQDLLKALTYGKRIDEVVEIIETGTEATAATKGLIPEVSRFRNTSRTHDDLTKRLGELNRELQSVNGELMKSPSTLNAARQRLREEADRLGSERERIEQEIETATEAAKELDEAFDLIDFWDTKGDRAFQKPEELQRLATKYPDIRRAQEAAFMTPGTAPKTDNKRLIGSTSSNECYAIWQRCIERCIDRVGLDPLMSTDLCQLEQCDLPFAECMREKPSSELLRQIEMWRALFQCAKASDACVKACQPLVDHNVTAYGNCMERCNKTQEACLARVPR